MRYAIIDCYTDEPAGLGVPPFLGTYPRYIYGKLIHEGHNVTYLTIDDLRKIFFSFSEKSLKTNIRTYNTTGKETEKEIQKADILIFVGGVHVPGKYLSAVPGNLHEIAKLANKLKGKRMIFTGPAATEFGSRTEGGKFSEKIELNMFEDIIPDMVPSYQDAALYSPLGARIVKQIPYPVIAEIETGRGCSKKIPCSFCTEPLKNRLEFRKIRDILAEVSALSKNGVEHFRLGKQSDLFSWKYDDLKKLLMGIRKLNNIKTLHIDNIDPVQVTEKKVELVVKYCTSGNVAALGAESFDPEVIKANNLHSSPEMTLKAIELINKYGRTTGENGMPRFLPGLNIIFGLINESKNTHVKNMEYLKKILETNLLLRRINIRQVAIFPGTQLDELAGNKYLRKNKKYYWKWRNEIRQKIDHEMLKRLLPVGSVLRDVRMEIHDGNTTFGRQIGTYPLIVGVKKKLVLRKEYDVRVTGHMLRSVEAEII